MWSTRQFFLVREAQLSDAPLGDPTSGSSGSKDVAPCVKEVDISGDALAAEVLGKESTPPVEAPLTDAGAALGGDPVIVEDLVPIHVAAPLMELPLEGNVVLGVNYLTKRWIVRNSITGEEAELPELEEGYVLDDVPGDRVWVVQNTREKPASLMQQTCSK